MINYAGLVQDFNGSLAVSTSRSLFYGQAGSGKTKLAATFPKCFFIDADKGMRSIAGVSDIKFIRLPGGKTASNLTGINSFELVMSILTDAKNSSGEFAPGKLYADRQTIVIDSMSSLVDEFMLKEIMIANNRDPLTEKAIFDDYGQLKNQCMQLGVLIKDVSDKLNVVVTALVDEEKDLLTGALEGKPLMTGKFRDIIGGIFDEEYYLESNDTGGGVQKYMLYAAKFKWYEAKTRLLSVNRLDVTNAGYDVIKKNYRAGIGMSASVSTPAVSVAKPVIVAAATPVAGIPSYAPKA